MKITDEELLGAIARGWCHVANEHKEMDAELALAIASEVRSVLPAALATQPDRDAENARLTAEVARLREAVKVAATAELYDPITGVIDADVLDVVQDIARAALEATDDQN